MTIFALRRRIEFMRVIAIIPYGINNLRVKR